ncbi:MAG: hypothetical protein ACTHU0_33060, partial [Kofleriaceae bacterium]
MAAIGTTTINGQSVPVEIERLFALPDKMRIDATLAGSVKVIVAINGRSGWQLAPGQTGGVQLTEVGAQDMASIDFERWREPELILLRALEPASKVAALPDEAIDGKPHAVLRLRSPFAGVDVQLFIDKKTKLLTRMTYNEGGQTQTDTFTEYKNVNGVQIAHKRESVGAGRSTKLEIKQVEVDPAVDAKLFEKPAQPK